MSVSSPSIAELIHVSHEKKQLVITVTLMPLTTCLSCINLLHAMHSQSDLPTWIPHHSICKPVDKFHKCPSPLLAPPHSQVAQLPPA